MKKIYFHLPQTVPSDQLKRAAHVLLFFATVLLASMVPNSSAAARVFRASSDAQLASVKLTPYATLTNNGTVGSTTTYSASVDAATASVTVTPTTDDPAATVTVNGVAVTSGTASGSITLGAVGTSTTIHIVVTAQDGTTTMTYLLLVGREPATATNLSNLAISKGVLSPAFASGTTSYTVANAGTGSVTVTPTTFDPTATVKVNGVAVTSGTASGSIALTPGGFTTINTVVTAQDGITTKTYTIAVFRQGGAGLSSIALTPNSTLTNAGTVGTTTTYTTTIGSGTTSVTVTPTAQDDAATITVNGIVVTSGTASGPIALATGASTTINIVVTAGDGTSATRSYKIIVNPSINASLSNLAISSGTLTPAFASGTISYTASVSSGTTSVTVTPTAGDPNATITVNGTAVTSGAASGSIAVVDGTTQINTVVTAQDRKTTKTYSITVTSGPATNANLSNLVISSGPITPVFASGTISYTASVFNSTMSLTVTPTTGDPNATVKVNGVAVTSGTASGSIALAEGAGTTINVVVTAHDGTTTKTYTIVVTRAPSNNPQLSGIVLTPYASLVNGGTVGTTTTYTASVGTGPTSVKVTPTAQDAKATITVNGVAVTSGTASGSIALGAVGTSTTINTVVTSQDGTATRTYKIIVTRAAPTNANLSNLAISSGTLTPAFATGTTSYSASVSYATASVFVTTTVSDPVAKIKVNGVAASSGGTTTVALAEGAVTPINVVVTAGDGTTTKTYTIAVTRGPASNAQLSTIALTPYSSLTNTGTTGTTTTYTTSVSNATTSVKVTPTTQDANAKVKVNGVAVTSGTASASIALAVGANAITTIVTAQDGTTTRTYSIKVTRATGPLHSLYEPVQPEVSVTKPTETVTIESDGITVHQGVSPNGDGINDVLTIDGITAYPNNHLTSIDRSGSLIFQAKGYDNITRAFDGHSGINGRMQQPGTYFYSLDYVADGQSKHKTGYILLKY